MATIELYKDKINSMSNYIEQAKSAVSDFCVDLSALKTKILGINSSVCDGIISKISTSSQTQEQQIAGLEATQKEVNDFIDLTINRDNAAADAVSKAKKEFYKEYDYLKPDSEKSDWEKFCDNIGEWCKKNWKKIIIGLAFIIIGAAITVITGGSAAAFIPALVAGLKSAAIAGLISAGINVVVVSANLLINDGNLSINTIIKSFADGFASGFMFGGIFAGGSQIIAGVMKTTAKFGIQGLKLGKVKIWSPNSPANPNSGGTLLKIGKTFRLDFEAREMLFHTHISKNLYNSFPLFIKQSSNWLFAPARRDVHVKLGTLLAGLIGGFEAKEENESNETLYP